MRINFHLKTFKSFNIRLFVFYQHYRLHKARIYIIDVRALGNMSTEISRNGEQVLYSLMDYKFLRIRTNSVITPFYRFISDMRYVVKAMIFYTFTLRH